MPRIEWRIMFAMSKEAVLRKEAPLLATLRLDPEAVESGLPVSTLTKFLSVSGMQGRDIYKVVISARTLRQRMKRKEPLTTDEADSLSRLSGSMTRQHMCLEIGTKPSAG